MAIEKGGESGYEDSAQRREQLEAELEAALDEVKKFLDIFKNDLSKADNSFERFAAINKQIEELTKSENLLREELKNMVTEYDNTPEDDKPRTKLEEKIDAQHDKIMAVWDQKNNLQEEQTKIITENTADRGDADGTSAVIDMKMQKIEEIKHQLGELDK